MSDMDRTDNEVILIVDDEPASRQIIRMVLESDGYTVEEAEDGIEALKKYALCHPCVVLLDAMMPRLNGFEVCAYLQKLPQEQQVPVIMITALDDQDSINSAFEAGAIDYVTKPVRWPVLRRRLRLLLQTKRAEKALQEEHNLLRTLIDNIPDCIFARDVDGRFILGNMAQARAAQVVTPKELVGKAASDLFLPAIAAQSDQDDQAILQSGAPLINVERLTADPNGGERVVLATEVPLRDSYGTIVGLLGISRDITERKQAERALRESEASEREQRTLAEALRDTSATLASVRDPDQVMACILENVGRVLPHDTAHILLIEGDSVQVAYGRGWSPDEDLALLQIRFPLDTPILRDMLMANRPVFVPDTTAYPGWLAAISPIGSYTGAPIRVHGEVIGFLGLASATPGFYSALHAERLGVFADQAAIAIENAQLYEALQHHATDLERRVVERTTELHQAKEYVEAILNNSSDAIVVTRSDGTVSQVNPALSELFGYQPEEVIGQSLWMLIEPDCVEALTEALQVVTDSGHSRRIELATRRRDGARFDADVALSLISQPSEQLAVESLSDVVFSARDITERKRIEEALRKSEEQLRRITDNMLDLIIQIDPEGNILYASPSCWNVLGYEADYLLGRAFASWLHPDDAEWVVAAIRETERLECRFRHADDRYLWLELIGNLLYTGDAFTGVVLSGRDVTARKRAEEELRVSEARYHSVVSVLAEGILIYNADGLCIDYNASAERLLELTDDVLRRQTAMEPAWSAIHEDGSPFAVEAQPTMLALGSGQPQSNIIMGVARPEGPVTWLSINAQPLLNEGVPRPYAVVVSLVDTTERIQMEIGLREALARQKELTDLKSRFVSMVSHEFRTPLATIQSTVDNLRYYADRMTEPQKLARMDKIQSQIQHMTRLLEDVLTLGRFEAGVVEFKPEAFDLADLFQEVVDDFRQAWPTHRLLYSRSDEVKLVTADKKLIRQIISNLLTNAGKYSPEESTITLDLTTQQDAVRFRVKDEGIGIPEKDLGHLFEAFYRAGNVGTIAGTGLGLSIIKHAIDVHSGTITVESAVGSGTAFTVTIPVHPSEEQSE